MPELARIFRGEPVRLRWAGWEATTHSLKSEGWEILAEERQSYFEDAHEVHIAARSPDSLLLIYGVHKVPMRELIARACNDHQRFLSQYMGYFLFDHGVEMKQYRAQDQIRIYEFAKCTIDAFNSMRPIDPFASTDWDMRTLSFKDMKVFSYNTSAPNEIYIPSKSVDECLDRILQLQFPEQQDIKKKLATVSDRDAEIARPVVQAKIYSLAA